MPDPTPPADMSAALTRFLFPWVNLAPGTNNQAINPGWSFGNVITVNEVNSTAPDVERAVVSQHSYGRQIGRLMDAVQALIEASDVKPGDARIKAFQDLAEKVNDIKRELPAEKIARLKRELMELRAADEKEFERLKKDVLK